MKKLSFTLLFSLLSLMSPAQCTVSATAIPGITLQCNSNQGQADRSSVAYNPGFDLYYSLNAGSPSYPVEVFSGSGTYLMYGDQGANYMGLWWNPNSGLLEGNTYGGFGIFEKDLYGTNGYPTGTSTNLMIGGQPDLQSVGNYDTLNNQYIYYYNGSYYTYDAATGAPVDTVTITGLPVSISNLNDNSVFYIGCAGMEYGAYDYVNKRFYFIDRATGAYVATSQLPITAPAASHFKASYANGRLWLFGTDFKWHSYLVMQNCVPPQATITVVGQAFGCLPGGSVLLAANTGTGLTYQWQEWGQDIAGATSSTYTATASNIYTVIVTENACSQMSASVNVPFYVTPSAGIAPFGDPLHVCQNDTLYIQTQATAMNYQWMHNNIIIPGATSNQYGATLDGIYTLITSNYSCSATATKTVIVDPLPTPVIVQNGNQLSTTQSYAGYGWQLNGNNIPGAINSTYTITQPGTYTVNVMDNYMCYNISAPYIPVLSVSNLLIGEFSVYPNPNNGRFIISGGSDAGSDKVSIKVTDIVGRLILQNEAAVKNGSIDMEVILPETDPGIYILLITSNGKHQVIPITIN